MTPFELMVKPSISRITVNGLNARYLRFLHWLGYWPERIEGPRQTMIKTLPPGIAFRAPAAEHAAYCAMVNA